MASKNVNGSDTDEEDEECDDSGFVHVGVSDISPIKPSSLDTKEKLKHELENYKEVNERLRGQIFKLNRRVQFSERKLQREKTLIEAAKNGELAKKDVKIQEAKVKMEDLSRRNLRLLVKITEYENSIKVLERNKREMMQKLTSFKDEDSNKVIKSESSKTEDTEKELSALKLRLQDMANELEEKNKIIANNLNDKSKMNEKLEQNMKDVKAVKHMLEESKKTEKKMANKVDNMEGMMKTVLAKVEALGQTSPPNDSRQLPASAGYSRGEQTPTDFRSPVLPKINKKKKTNYRWE